MAFCLLFCVSDLNLKHKHPGTAAPCICHTFSENKSSMPPLFTPLPGKLPNALSPIQKRFKQKPYGYGGNIFF